MKTSRGEGWGSAATRGAVDRRPAAGDVRRRELDVVLGGARRRSSESDGPRREEALQIRATAAGGVSRGPAARGEDPAANPNTTSPVLVCFLSHPALPARSFSSFPAAPVPPFRAPPRRSARLIALRRELTLFRAHKAKARRFASVSRVRAHKRAIRRAFLNFGHTYIITMYCSIS